MYVDIIETFNLTVFLHKIVNSIYNTFLLGYSEVFPGPEKRRKRGSLFSRKKKDKTKSKGQSVNCDGELDRFF